MKTGNKPNDSTDPFGKTKAGLFRPEEWEIVNLVDQSSVFPEDTTKQLVPVEKEWISGKEVVVQRNIEIPKIENEKNATKAMSVAVAILEFIYNKKISQEAAFKALQQSMKEKGRTRLLKTHTKRETNPALPGNVESRGCLINQIREYVTEKELSGGKTYVQPLLRLIKKWDICDTFQLLDKRKEFAELSNKKEELEKKGMRTPEEEKKLRKLIRDIPKVEKICSVYILANENTENFLNLVDGVVPRDKEQPTHWIGILRELTDCDYV